MPIYQEYMKKSQKLKSLSVILVIDVNKETIKKYEHKY